MAGVQCPAKDHVFAKEKCCCFKSERIFSSINKTKHRSELICDFRTLNVKTRKMTRWGRGANQRFYTFKTSVFVCLFLFLFWIATLLSSYLIPGLQQNIINEHRMCRLNFADEMVTARLGAISISKFNYPFFIAVYSKTYLQNNFDLIRLHFPLTLFLLCVH